MKIGIYIPGLGYGLGKVTLSTYANSFARALDKNDENKLYEYGVKIDKKVFASNGGQQEITVARIYKKLPENQTEEDVYKFYEFNYEDTFTEKTIKTNILGKSLRMIWGIGRMLPVFILTCFHRGLSGKQKFQSLYFFFVLILLSFVTALILPSLFAIVADNFKGSKDLIKNALSHSPYWTNFAICIKNISHYIVVLTSALAILLPGIQKKMSVAADEYLCVHYYLKYGEGRQALVGNLSNLIEKVSETEKDYDGFEIHGYSFGSIIALDTLFPGKSQQTDFRTSNEITQLVSVGCPYDFIRVYYPYYFANRQDVSSHLKKWYNINCETDILSSNFRNDPKTGDGDVKVTPGAILVNNIMYDVAPVNGIKFFDYLLLMSFSTHRMYWSEDADGMSFFTNYINQLKADKA